MEKDEYLKTNLKKFVAQKNMTLNQLEAETNVKMEYIEDMFHDGKILVKDLPASVVINLVIFFGTENLYKLFPNIENL